MDLPDRHTAQEQCFGPGSGLEPDSIVSGARSGSRQTKMTHKIVKKQTPNIFSTESFVNFWPSKTWIWILLKRILPSSIAALPYRTEQRQGRKMSRFYRKSEVFLPKRMPTSWFPAFLDIYPAASPATPPNRTSFVASFKISIIYWNRF